MFLSADIIAHKDNKALPLKNKLQKSFSTANFNDWIIKTNKNSVSTVNKVQYHNELENISDNQ